jgi:GNAT superfamily N-acetyltransferase
MLTVERLDDAGWARLRDLRLRALADEPDAFGSTLAEEAGRDDDGWVRFLALGPWWLAVGDGRDVGLVAGGTRDGDASTRWVYSMWVEAAWRGRGVGDALLDAVRAWAAGDGATRLGLDVTDRVPRARRFYERYGFEATGLVVPLPRDTTVSLVELAIPLAPRGGAAV